MNNRSKKIIISLWTNIWNRDRRYRKLAFINREVIRDYNEKLLSTLSLLGGLLMLLPIMAVPFSETKVSIVFVYYFVAIMFFGLFLVYRLSFMRKHILV